MHHQPPLVPLVRCLEAWLALRSPSRWRIRTIWLGYAIQFARRHPKFSSILETSVAVRDAAVLHEEIAVLLAKDAIEPVTPAEMRPGFYSPYFIVPKKGGGLRPILDLWVLNRAIHNKLQFKMLMQKCIIRCIQPQDWFAASIWQPQPQSRRSGCFIWDHFSTGYTPKSRDGHGATVHIVWPSHRCVAALSPLDGHCFSMGRGALRTSVPACCLHDRCIQYGLGCYMQRAGSLGAVFGPAYSHAALIPRPGYVPKVSTTPFHDQVVNLQALPLEEADPALAFLCPVRALCMYVDHTQSFRSSEQLFVCYGGQQKGKAVSKQRLAHWIVEWAVPPLGEGSLHMECCLLLCVGAQRLFGRHL